MAAFKKKKKKKTNQKERTDNCPWQIQFLDSHLWWSICFQYFLLFWLYIIWQLRNFIFVTKYR
jgi:hypothetical protein